MISRTTHPDRIKALHRAAKDLSVMCDRYGGNLAELSSDELSSFDSAAEKVATCHRDCGSATHLSNAPRHETLHDNKATVAAMEKMRGA